MLKYPLYEAQIKESDEGIFKISLVEDPAVESLWEAFDKVDEKPVQMFSVEDEEERIVTGCFLRADYPILRRKGDDYFYLTFSKDTIKLMVMKWLAEGRANLLNTNHDSESKVDNVFLEEVFIKNSDRGIDPKGFEKVEEGSAFASYKVLDDEIWESIKNGEFKGFSVEAQLEVSPVKDNKEEVVMDEIIDLLNKIKNTRK